jgi:hypothetical protein
VPKSPERVISDQMEFWSLEEIQLLFGPLPERELRRLIAENEIHAAGVRPARGRGRPPLVYPAGAVCDALGAL